MLVERRRAAIDPPSAPRFRVTIVLESAVIGALTAVVGYGIGQAIRRRRTIA